MFNETKVKKNEERQIERKKNCSDTRNLFGAPKRYDKAAACRCNLPVAETNPEGLKPAIGKIEQYLKT